MNLLAYILSAAAVLLTAAIFSFAHTPGPRHGPDAAGIEGFYMLVCPLRWVIVAVLLGLTARATGLAGTGRHMGVAMAVLLGLHLAGGVLSISSFMGLRQGGTREQLGAWVFGYIIPLFFCAYAIAALQWRGDSLWQKIALVIVALVTLAGSAVGLQGYSQYRTEKATSDRSIAEEKSATEAKEQTEREARDQARRDELDRLPATESLLVWLRFFATCDGEVRQATAQRIMARPDFSQELGALLQTEDRVSGLQFFWWYLPHPPQALVAPFQACLDSMPAWTEKTFATIDEQHATEVNWASEAIVIIADRFENKADFRPAIERLSAFIEERYAFNGFRSRGLLKGWLERDAARRQSASSR
jgi:hypothetical protein